MLNHDFSNDALHVLWWTGRRTDWAQSMLEFKANQMKWLKTNQKISSLKLEIAFKVYFFLFWLPFETIRAHSTSAFSYTWLDSTGIIQRLNSSILFNNSVYSTIRNGWAVCWMWMWLWSAVYANDSCFRCTYECYRGRRLVLHFPHC